jgi:hypothetical protein
LPIAYPVFGGSVSIEILAKGIQDLFSKERTGIGVVCGSSTPWKTQGKRLLRHQILTQQMSVFGTQPYDAYTIPWKEIDGKV